MPSNFTDRVHEVIEQSLVFFNRPKRISFGDVPGQMPREIIERFWNLGWKSDAADFAAMLPDAAPIAVARAHPADSAEQIAAGIFQSFVKHQFKEFVGHRRWTDPIRVIVQMRDSLVRYVELEQPALAAQLN